MIKETLKNRLKAYIRRNPRLYKLCLFLFYIVRPLYPQKMFLALSGYFRFCRDVANYFSMDGSEQFKLLNLRPSLEDWNSITPVDRYYFYQDTWAAGKIIKNVPEFHVDIGSTVLFVGILSKITRICSVDIRPLPVSLENLECRRGSILELPFEDGKILSLSSLCVIEHIGLGRYGDPLDPSGTYKAVQELSRVLGGGGDLYVSVPIGESSVYFNACRVFEPEDFVSMFKGFRVVDTLFILEDRVCTMDEYMKLDKSPYINRMIVGCFHFQKEK